ncbi:MAG: HypC/HybG/HupF family hydrogenase formation chaperone [Candidatus Contendobacter sp.]|nr:HypC/HybG/HupF family hydrogenase formation chaperone [Candidatus Contendobacter sp.]MDS4057633.1 HypC/HybG/HupF family hydrogenase formation chaperone [Candidatus Contendobacter sp.]
MCLAIPAQVVETPDAETAVVELDGIRKSISTALLDEVTVGDYVIVHVGYALERLNVTEAEATLRLFAELAASATETSLPSIKPL